ncbi:MAG: BlaI/MecI/CopY family transcriptional regulator [Colwelliaceae bacterium]|nr:BlaI/MecI/CopY family transcriptional regulator [Colwelliaceae bacterium]
MVVESNVDISNAEFEVLDALWQQYPATANEIVERLNQGKQWHDKTVKTLLNRLVKKEAISFEKEQRRYLYFPLVEREAYTQYESQSLIERMFSGRVSPLIAGFAKNKNLQKDDIEELKQIISSWEHENIGEGDD